MLKQHANKTPEPMITNFASHYSNNLNYPCILIKLLPEFPDVML